MPDNNTLKSRQSEDDNQNYFFENIFVPYVFRKGP